MRKFNLLLGLLLFATVSLKAQENLKYEKVIHTDSIGKTMLFSTINDWFASTYNSANEVIQMSDKNAGILIGNGLMSYEKKGMSFKCYSGYVKYTIKVYVKGNRYKVVLTNFNHSVNIGNAPSCALGAITNADVYTTKGMSKKYHNSVWDDIKLQTEIYSNGIFDSMGNKTKNLKNASEVDDW